MGNTTETQKPKQKGPKRQKTIRIPSSRPWRPTLRPPPPPPPPSNTIPLPYPPTTRTTRSSSRPTAPSATEPSRRSSICRRPSSSPSAAEAPPPDHKGKRKLASEAGCSSGSKRRRAPNCFRCGICMEMVSISEQFITKLCAHAFCKGCIGKYVAAKIRENAVSIKCPDPGCKDSFLAMEVCRDIIPVELFDKWSVTLCESALGAKKYYCPFKDCSALLIYDSREKITNSECPHCHRMFCAQCRVPWHGGVSCEVFGKLAKDERGKDDLVFKKLADKCKWQRCPKCKMYVERIDGCLLMKCRCGSYFCYHCAAPMSMNLHYCVKCKH